MPRPSSIPSHAIAASGFAGHEWRLITRLPAEVMVTTVVTQNGGGPRYTVAEGLAGLDAIAAGRVSDSDLVRAVVAAIYAEPEPDADRQCGAPDRSGVLADCRRVAEILRASADPADAAAYRHWVQQVAIRVCRAARSGGVFGLSGERIDPVEQAFLDDLAAALS
jgi:hypothetical protein